MSRGTKPQTSTKKAGVAPPATTTHSEPVSSKKGGTAYLLANAAACNCDPGTDLDLALRLEAAIARLYRSSEEISRRQAAQILLSMLGRGWSAETYRRIEDGHCSAEHARRQALLLAVGGLSLSNLARIAVELALDAVARGQKLDARDVLLLGEVLDQRLVILEPEPQGGGCTPPPTGGRHRRVHVDDIVAVADGETGRRSTLGGGRAVKTTD